MTVAKKTIAEQALDAAVSELPAGNFMDDFLEMDKVLGKTGLQNLKLEDGENFVRIISVTPYYLRSHWSVPVSAGQKGAAPCLKHVKAGEFQLCKENPSAYFAAQVCPWCDYEAEFNEKKMGKDGALYVLNTNPVFNVIHEGEIKMWTVSAGGIKDGIKALYKSKAWAKFFGKNGITDLELIITKEKGKNGVTKYSVGGNPSTEPLSDESLTDLRDRMPDIAVVKAPPSDEAKIREFMLKFPKPTMQDVPTKF